MAMPQLTPALYRELLVAVIGIGDGAIGVVEQIAKEDDPEARRTLWVRFGVKIVEALEPYRDMALALDAGAAVGAEALKGEDVTRRDDGA